jgi:hypothetical protein
MVTITFDYDTWNPTKESIPRRASQKRRSQVTEPFTDGALHTALFSGVTPKVGDPLRAEVVETLQANLWYTLTRFRQLGVSDGDLQRLIKDYPNKGSTDNEKALHSVRDTVGRFSNPSNKKINLPLNSKWRVEQQGDTGDVWTLHPA